MGVVTNLIVNKLHPVTGEDLKPTIVTAWRDGTTTMTDSLCGGLYNKDTEITSPTYGSYFKWNASGSWPVSRLTTINQSNFQKLINDFGAIPVTILLDKTINITSNITIPSNIGIEWYPGAVFNIASGIVLTIHSNVQKGKQKLFSGPGSVSLDYNSINLSWLGITSASSVSDIQSALTLISARGYKKVIIDININLLSGKITFPLNLDLQFINNAIISTGRIQFLGKNQIISDRVQIFDGINFQIFKEDEFGRVKFSTVATTPVELNYTNAVAGDNVITLPAGTFYEFGDVRNVIDPTTFANITITGNVDFRRVQNIQPIRLGKLITNNIIYAEWFGCFPNLDTDTTLNFQNAFDFQQITSGGSLDIPVGVYNWVDRVIGTSFSGKQIKGCIATYGYFDMYSISTKGRNSEVSSDTSPTDSSVLIKTTGFVTWRRHPYYRKHTLEVFPKMRNIRFERQITITNYTAGTPEFIAEKKRVQGAHLFHHMVLKSAVIDNVVAGGYGIIINGSLAGVTSFFRCRMTAIYRSVVSGRGYTTDNGMYGDDGFHPYRWGNPFTDSFIGGGNYFNASTSIYAKDTCAFEIHGGSKTTIFDNFFDFWSTIASAPYYGSTETIAFVNNTFDSNYRLFCPYHVLVRNHTYGMFADTYVGAFPGLTWDSNRITNHVFSTLVNWHSDPYVLYDMSMREAFLDGSVVVKTAAPAFSNTTMRNTTIEECDMIIKVKSIAGMYNTKEIGTKLVNQSSLRNLSEYVDFGFTGLYGDAKNRRGNYFESYNNLVIEATPFTAVSAILPNPRIKSGGSGYSTQSYQNSTDGINIITSSSQVSRSFDRQTIYLQGAELLNYGGAWKFISGQIALTSDYLWGSPVVDGLRFQYGNVTYLFKITSGVTGNYFYESGFNTEVSDVKSDWFSRDNVFGIVALNSGKYHVWNGFFWEDQKYKVYHYVAPITADFTVPKGNSTVFLSGNLSTVDRSVILETASADNAGEYKVFFNRNTGGFNWVSSQNLIDCDGTTLTILPAGVITIRSAASVWRVENIYTK